MMMRWIALLLPAMILWWWVPLSADSRVPEGLDAYVVNVDDGDTLIVSIDHEAVIVDLAGVVCPGTDEDQGRQAKRFTKQMVMSRHVRVVPQGRADLDRITARVFVDQHCLNEVLIKQGFGHAQVPSLGE